MFKKALSFLFLFLLSYEVEANEYIIRYQPLSSGTVYLIETKGGIAVGTIKREQEEKGLFYSFLTLDEEVSTFGPVEHHDSETYVRLVAPMGDKIGWFAAQINHLYPTEYKIFSSENQLIAKGSMNWLGNHFTLTDPKNPKYFLATFSRPKFKLFNDYWHISIHEEGTLDRRLLFVIGAFQTACDLNLEFQKRRT